MTTSDTALPSSAPAAEGSTASTAVDALLERATRSPYATDAPLLPKLRVAILTCMDSRIDVFRIFGLDEGDAHVMRNAGGYATPDMVRSLAISQRKIGTREILVLHHTNCGMTGLRDAEFRAEIAAETGVTPEWDVEGYDDPREAVRASVAAITASVLVPFHDSVRGGVYDVTSGRLEIVV
ncbi:MAG: carbonic anhydrase [Frankiaceae bacterium]|jgi:carbonic anhydrase|nr:carbonic anhydrase [Frankiaceae bacterium]